MCFVQIANVKLFFFFQFQVCSLYKHVNEQRIKFKLWLRLKKVWNCCTKNTGNILCVSIIQYTVIQYKYFRNLWNPWFSAKKVPLSKEPCFEDDTAYFGNNARTGGENPQKSRLDCQQSCEFHPSCHYWTFRKPDLQSNGDSPAQRGQNLSEVAFLLVV